MEKDNKRVPLLNKKVTYRKGGNQGHKLYSSLLLSHCSMNPRRSLGECYLTSFSFSLRLSYFALAFLSISFSCWYTCCVTARLISVTNTAHIRGLLKGWRALPASVHSAHLQKTKRKKEKKKRKKKINIRSLFHHRSTFSPLSLSFHPSLTTNIPREGHIGCCHFCIPNQEEGTYI